MMPAIWRYLRNCLIFGIIRLNETDGHRHERLPEAEGEGVHLRRQDCIRPPHGERCQHQTVLHFTSREVRQAAVVWTIH